MPKRKPKVVSRCQIGFLDITINGVSAIGGGLTYSRTEYADGRVVETGGPIALPPGASPLAAIADAIAPKPKRGRRA